MGSSKVTSLPGTITLRARRLTGVLPQSVRIAIRRVLFIGITVTCDLCGSRVRGLVSHGGGPEVLDRRRVAGGMTKENDRCPVCHGRDRTRALKSRLDEIISQSNATVRILHVAPEYGLYRWLSTARGVDYTVSDLDAKRYRNYSSFVEADLTSLPFPDSSFDVVICSHVLEHITDDRAAMQEIRRVLAPRGETLIMVPEADDGLPTDEDLSVTEASARTARFGQWDHVRLYSRGDMGVRLGDLGFTVTTYEPSASAASAETLYLAVADK